ncbi:hypothetical protein IID62_11320 [candidate division KSB1 bacterium]|nr:hypothetical protein [candidate division KSB1 bacterium]
MMKIFNIVFSVTLLILAGSFIESLYAQVPPVLPASPTPPVGLIPWGNPLIYFAIVFGYSLYRMNKTNKDQ